MAVARSAAIAPAAGAAGSDPTGGSLAWLDEALARHGFRPDALLEILHLAQLERGFLSREVLRHVARGLALPPSHVQGVATFYNAFTFRPPGAHTCTVCTGTACHVERADAILAALGEALGVEPGETTADGRVSLRIARCVGTCGLAPVVTFDDEAVGRQTCQAVLARLARWGGP